MINVRVRVRVKVRVRVWIRVLRIKIKITIGITSRITGQRLDILTSISNCELFGNIIIWNPYNINGKCMGKGLQLRLGSGLR